jgi:alpha-glucosidase (family GH31 glycosyl hydrolase)
MQVFNRVWPPQPVAFPDFTNVTGTHPWWQSSIQRWLQSSGARASGLWIDMNEPSAFCNGELGVGCRTVTGPPYSENTTAIPLADQQLMVQWGIFVDVELARVQANAQARSLLHGGWVVFGVGVGSVGKASAG